MRIVETVKKKATWRLARLHLPDGRVLLHTGRDLSRPVRPMFAARGEPGRVREAARVMLRRADGSHETVEARIELVDNVVFEAALRPRLGEFQDRDEPGTWFKVRAQEAFEILEAACAGRATLVDGHIVGRYTFIKPAVGNPVLQGREEGGARSAQACC